MGIERWLERLMIPEIQLGNIDIGIGQVSNLIINDTPDWLKTPSHAVPIYPPVTTQVGVPIVNMPGCVESHRDSSENQTLKDEDSDGVRVFCDAGTPSFNPIDYDPNRLEVTTKSPPPPVVPNTPETPETPATPAPPRTDAAIAECPTVGNKQLKNPVGKVSYKIIKRLLGMRQ